MRMSGQNVAALHGGAGGGGSDPDFSSVVFLAGWEGSDGATSYSEEKNSRAGTFTFNAQIDTAQFKYGASSLLSDGASDAVTFADNADWDLSNANSDEFTIECWVRTNTTTPSGKAIIAHFGSVGTISFLFWAAASGNGELAFWGSTDLTSFDIQITASGMTWSTGTWYHVACDKDSSGKIRVYRDGTMVASGTPGNSALANPATELTIGNDGSVTRSWDGWIDECRITKGVARYADDGGFTPPSDAFPRS